MYSDGQKFLDTSCICVLLGIGLICTLFYCNRKHWPTCSTSAECRPVLNQLHQQDPLQHIQNTRQQQRYTFICLFFFVLRTGNNKWLRLLMCFQHRHIFWSRLLCLMELNEIPLFRSNLFRLWCLSYTTISDDQSFLGNLTLLAQFFSISSG